MTATRVAEEIPEEAFTARARVPAVRSADSTEYGVQNAEYRVATEYRE